MRLGEAAKKGVVDMYFMEINNALAIDARTKGNLSRFINHSCDPNCELQKWCVPPCSTTCLSLR